MEGGDIFDNIDSKIGIGKKIWLKSSSTEKDEGIYVIWPNNKKYVSKLL